MFTPVNPCSVTCSPAALQSYFPFCEHSQGELCVYCQPQQPLQTDSLNLYRRAVAGNYLDFWFRHHTSFLWCLRPAVGCFFSTLMQPSQIYTFSQNDGTNNKKKKKKLF